MRPASIPISMWSRCRTPSSATSKRWTSLQIEQMTGAVELVEALGGGWDATQLPTPSASYRWHPSKADTKIQQ